MAATEPVCVVAVVHPELVSVPPEPGTIPSEPTGLVACVGGRRAQVGCEASLYVVVASIGFNLSTNFITLYRTYHSTAMIVELIHGHTFSATALPE